jgi:hypothetical protein
MEAARVRRRKPKLNLHDGRRKDRVRRLLVSAIYTGLQVQ